MYYIKYYLLYTIFNYIILYYIINICIIRYNVLWIMSFYIGYKSITLCTEIDRTYPLNPPFVALAGAMPGTTFALGAALGLALGFT